VSPTEPDAFPLVRRGYDPAAVHHHLELLEIKHRAARLPEDEARELSTSLVEAAHDQAAHILATARRMGVEAQDRHEASTEVLASAERERSRLLEDGSAAAAELVEEARRQAAEILDQARDAEGEVRSNRWADVSDRVARILAVADDEGDGLLGEARDAAEALRAESEAAAETLRTESVAEVARIRGEADRYAADTRAQADDWASARTKAADADLTKASEVLEEAHGRAERLQVEAEAKVAAVHDDASRRTTEHVQQLLAEARYDLDQLESRAVEARTYLQGLRDLAIRALAADEERPAGALAAVQ